MKLLLTGEPKSGKTTLLEGFVATVPHKQGFITREVREAGERIGFALISSYGTSATLASISSDSDIRVSKYGVELGQLDTFLKGLPPIQKGNLLYVDEIGQMELFSPAFKELVARYLNADNLYAGTITSVYQDDFTREVLSRSDVVLLHITPDNRDEIREVLEGFSASFNKLNMLNKKQMKAMTGMARKYAGSSNLTQLRKLLKNAVAYVVEGNIIQQSPDKYLVHGNTRDHTVGVFNKRFTCDCDLFKGVGDYAGRAGECSHIQAVKLAGI